MEQMQYSFDEFGLSSKLIRAFINQDERVSNFTDLFFSEQALLEQTSLKHFDKGKRVLLTDVLRDQNQSVKLSELSRKNLDKLNDEHTYTITTGHQLNMATGPLYTIYKILEIINWCDKLNEQQNEQHFVPMFWMATEDHDFDEINHIHLYGSKIDWQHNDVQNSIVGRISTEPTAEFLSQILDKFNDETLRSKVEEFLKFTIIMIQ